MTDTALVTGGSGFVATHLVSRLLDRGYTVRASVRSRASTAKAEPLRRLMVSIYEMARIIRSRYPRRVLIPRHRLPDAAVRVLGPRFGLTPDYIAKHLGISFAVDNHRSVDKLGLVYRSVRETMLDHYESWRARRGK